MKQQVFVYGSLKKGFGNHQLLERGDAKFVGDAQVSGFQLFSLGPFPAVVPGNGTVSGEVYEVGPETLAALDRLEGHPTFYQRQDRIVRMAKTHESKVIALYCYQGEVEEQALIANGNWEKEHVLR